MYAIIYVRVNAKIISKYTYLKVLVAYLVHNIIYMSYKLQK